MKKLLSLVMLATLSCGCLCATPSLAQDKQPVEKQQVRQQFEQRLKLTDKQKEKAKAIHQKGMEEMKPVMVQIDAKRKEIKNVVKSELDEKSKKEKIDKIREELKPLEKQAREIRMKNSQEFEKILNKKQLKELEQMKAEGRAKFRKHHPTKAPFNMFGSPEAWQKKQFSPENN